MLAGEQRQVALEIGAEGDAEPRPRLVADGGHRPVRRQLQGGRHAGQPLPPVVELALQHLPLEPPPLPDGEVGILDLQLRERRRRAGGRRAVELGDLAHDHPQRPAVGDDVVHVEQEGVLGGRQPQQGGAQERAALEVERAVDLLLGEAPGLALARRGGEGREVDERQAPGDGGGDHLHRPPPLLPEGGAQRLVPADDLAEDGPQDGRRDLPLDPQRQRDVVGGELRLQAVDEPEALLGEGGGGRIALRRAAGDARGPPLGALLALAKPFEQERPLLARQGGEQRRRRGLTQIVSSSSSSPSPSPSSKPAASSSSRSRAARAPTPCLRIVRWLPGTSKTFTSPATSAPQPSAGSSARLVAPSAARKSWRPPP